MGGLQYAEESGELKVENVGRSHLSIEIGHFYMKDFKNKSVSQIEGVVRAQLARTAPMVEVMRKNAVAGTSSRRVSTCFLIDDYFGDSYVAPKEFLQPLLKVAAEVGIEIDYIGREAACATNHDGIELAEIVAAMVHSEPSPGTTGARPAARDSGWLCNGERSPVDAEQLPIDGMAMAPARRWVKPKEYWTGRHQHAVFVDVEMWRDQEIASGGGSERLWSCAFLATVWQLLRLGMVRNEGKAVVKPQLWEPGDSLAEQWAELPSILQVNPNASPFAAFRTASILPREFLRIEHAVRVIFDHLQIDGQIVDQADKRAEEEKLGALPRAVGDRLSHLFIEGA